MRAAAAAGSPGLGARPDDRQHDRRQRAIHHRPTADGRVARDVASALWRFGDIVRCSLCGRYRGEKPTWPEGPEMSPMIHLRHRPDRFRYRDLWNVERSTPGNHSRLMPANLTTLPHFSVSAATKLPKSAGEPAITVPPISASRALSWESARAALIWLLSLLTISAGVPVGAPMPYQPLDS